MYDLCLVSPPCHYMSDDRIEPPLGLLYIATYLKARGFAVAVCDLSSIPEDEWSVPPAKCYGISATTPNYPTVLQVREFISNRFPNARLVIGGAHASGAPFTCTPYFDYVVVGEGEIAMEHILQNKVEKGVVVGEVISNLDDLPFPDYSLVDIHSYHRTMFGESAFCIVSSRGCPYKCVFCNSVVMGSGRGLRLRSVQNVVAEMDLLHEIYGTSMFRFQDDLFVINRRRVEQFVNSLLPRGYLFRCFARVDHLLDPGVTRQLYDSGCRHLSLGIESGADSILELMQKGFTSEEVAIGIDNAKNAGLVVRVFLIVGFPGETDETIEETLSLMRDHPPDEFAVYPIIPYLGSRLVERLHEFGITWMSSNLREYWQVYGDRQNVFPVDFKHMTRIRTRELLKYVIEEMEKISMCRNKSQFK